MQQHVQGEPFGFGQPDVLAVLNDGDSASSQPAWFWESLLSLGTLKQLPLGAMK